MDTPKIATAAQLIARHHFITLKDLSFIKGVDPRVAKNIETELKYKVYIAQQMRVSLLSNIGNGKTQENTRV